MNNNNKGGSSKDKRKKTTSRKRSARRSSRKSKHRLVFPIVEIHHAFCGDEPIEKVEAEAALFVTAAETYLAHEILELACNHAISSRGSRELTAADIIAVIQNDDELTHIFGDVIENELNEMKERKEAKEKKGKEAKEKRAEKAKAKKQKSKEVEEKSPESEKGGFDKFLSGKF